MSRIRESSIVRAGSLGPAISGALATLARFRTGHPSRAGRFGPLRAEPCRAGNRCVLRGGDGTRRENSAGRHCSPLAAGGRHSDIRHARAWIAKPSPNMLPAPFLGIRINSKSLERLSGKRVTGVGDASAPNVRHLVAAPVSHKLHFPGAGVALVWGVSGFLSRAKPSPAMDTLGLTEREPPKHGGSFRTPRVFQQSARRSPPRCSNSARNMRSAVARARGPS
jgi:hypothetical protein